MWVSATGGGAPPTNSLDDAATREPPVLGREDYSELFGQFERAVIEAECAFERRQAAQELLGRITTGDRLSPFSTGGRSRSRAGVDTITRTELLALRDARPDRPGGAT